jgi:Asparagine synthase
MYGLFAVFGPAAQRLTRDRILSAVKGVAPAELDLYTDGRAVSVALLSPSGAAGAAPFEWTGSGRLGFALDGYVVTATDGPHSLQRQRLMRLIETEGLEAALQGVVAGAFNLAVLDLDRGIFSVANDRVGSIPIYYSVAPEGCVVATAPGLVGAVGLGSREPDLTAIAELVFLGHTVGDRYFSKDMRRLPAASILRWDERSGELAVSSTGLSPLRLGSVDREPELDEVAELVRAACRRIAGLGGRNALLLSGGMDSRLILAAWPGSEPLPCYSYGPPEFADVAFARATAAIRASTFTRIPLEGDEVAAGIDEMTRLCGPPTFPHRYLAARRVAADGLDTVLDGYAGDVLLGGSYYGFGRFLSLPRRWAQLGNRLADRRICEVGFDALAESLLESLLDPGAAAWLARYCNPDIARLLAAERPAMLQDVWTTLRQLAPSDGSVDVAVRDFKLTQRALHSTIHQGVLCRRFARVAYPLLCDVALLEALWTIAPRHTAHRRLYVRLFRRHFPGYAEVPYTASLLPLKRSPLLHRWTKALRSRGVRLPFQARTTVSERYNEWDTWLRESPALRNRASALLSDLGMADRPHLQAAIERIGTGEHAGSGDLLHVGALSHLVEPLTIRMQDAVGAATRSHTVVRQG